MCQRSCETNRRPETNQPIGKNIEMQPIAEQVPRESNRVTDAANSLRRLGVSDEQRSCPLGEPSGSILCIAKALRNGPFDMHLGCMRRRGAFLEGIEHIAEFDVAGSFLTHRHSAPVGALATPSQTGRCGCPCLRLLCESDVDSRCSMGTRSGGYREPASTRRSAQSNAESRAVGRVSTLHPCGVQLTSGSQSSSERWPAGIQDRSHPERTPGGSLLRIRDCLTAKFRVVRVGLIARMNHPGKNQDLFLQAAAAHRRALSRSRVCPSGRWSLSQRLERLAEKLGIAHRVQFLGERMDIPAVLATLDISVVVF